MSSESATRKEIIDLRLKDAGWDVSDRTQVIEIQRGIAELEEILG